MCEANLQYLQRRSRSERQGSLLRNNFQTGFDILPALSKNFCCIPVSIVSRGMKFAVLLKSAFKLPKSLKQALIIKRNILLKSTKPYYAKQLALKKQ